MHTPPRQDENEKRFYAGRAVDPSPRIRLEEGLPSSLSMRAMDLLSPIGMGQRGYIVAPPGSGKTTLLKDLCKAVAQGQPAMKLYCLLINERPEEVTDFKRSVPAEVMTSGRSTRFIVTPARARQRSGRTKVRHSPTGAARSAPVIGTETAFIPSVTAPVGAASTR